MHIFKATQTVPDLRKDPSQKKKSLHNYAIRNSLPPPPSPVFIPPPRLCTFFNVIVRFYFNACTVHLLLFCIMTNKCTIISQIITILHVSTLSCHPQGACNQYTSISNAAVGEVRTGPARQ